MSSYTLRGVVKRYSRRTVLCIEQLTIIAGHTLALLGPSGAGKSTLLRLLNFLEAPDAGQIEYDGRAVSYGRLPLATLREVTTVFQRPLLLDTTVWQNVAYGLRLRGRSERAAIEAALEQVGLAHLARAPGRTLSGGEAQRVALARAMVVSPRVLLLDEPTANLDPANVAIIEAVAQELRRQGTTIVIVTHNLFQARRLADEAALLIDGALVEAGLARKLFECPRDPRTAAFLEGRMVY
ncbi:MAG: ATP-binding cassette domain-containing protein [Chloroflexales bacterium]|nr:ATP-binding cassette domain-containing protein [Chloroflexales bacterium]